MIIKKYIANNLDAALEQMRKELGPESTVLTSQEVTRSGLLGWLTNPKVEITAAVEPEALHRHKGAAAAKREEKAQSKLDRNLEELKALFPEEEPATYADPRMKRKTAPKRSSEAESDIRRLTQGLVERFGEEAPAKREEPTEDSLRKVIREEMRRSQKSVSVGPLEGNDESIVGSVRFLMAKGVSRQIALEIDEELDRKVGKVDMTHPSKQQRVRINGIHRELASRFRAAGPIRTKPGATTYAALVGPTGVGKTTTLAKIASEYVGQGKRVGVISLDTVKVGAREQIKALTDRLQIPLMVVSNQFELRDAVGELEGQDLVLIDTAGCNQYNASQVQKLAEILGEVRRLQVMLVVSATTKDVDVIGTVKNFAPIAVDSLIFTKLDETIAHGIMVNVCDQTGLPVRYLSNGQGVSDLILADPREISRTILLEANEAEHRSLREMVAG